MARQFNLPGYRRAGILFLAIALLGLLAVPGCYSSFQPIKDSQQEAKLPPSPKIGYLAPDFTLADLDGNSVTLSDFRGKVVFINFWASWCPPCRAEMPAMEAVYQEYKDKGVVVIGVDIMEPEDVVRQFVSQEGYSWTFALDSTGEVARDYQIVAIPTSFFLDKEGIIRAGSIGAMTKQVIEAKLTEAMR